MIDKQQLSAMGEHMREMDECKQEFKVPDGWKLVPDEITQEMYTIGGIEYEDPAKSWESGTFLTSGECAKAIYWAMLDAAPEYKP